MPSRRKSGSAKRRTFDVINPTTEKALATYPILTAPQVRTKVGAAREAFRSWSRLDPKERAAYLLRFAEILRKHKDTYAQTMTLEMGKVIREAVAEVEKCAWAAEYFAENGPGLLQPEIVTTDAMRSYVAFHARVVRGSIMPWNCPMWQIVRFAVPALIAGNTVVVKPASASPQSALHLEVAFREAPSRWSISNRRWRSHDGDGAHPISCVRCEPDGIRRHRGTGGPRGLERPEEGHPRAGRLRPVHRRLGCGPRCGREGRRGGTIRERRTVVHCREAFLRRGQRGKGIPCEVRGEHAAPPGGRSVGSVHGHRAARQPDAT